MKEIKKMSETYSNQEVQEILREATTMQKDSEISQEQLLEIAAEIGISGETLEQAKQAYLQKKIASQKLAKRRNKFIRFHLIPYIAVSVFLILLNLVTTPRNFWSIYPILGWGLGVTIDGSCIYSKNS